MKRNPSEQGSARLLILSDGKPGHVNQSIAFARHLQLDFDICPVRFASRGAKLLSYLLDRLGIYTASLLDVTVEPGGYAAIVSTGSETYYANKLLARQARTRSVAIMLPRGYRYDFDLIVAQQHDAPPQRDNLLSVPVNLTFAEPQGLVAPEAPQHQYVAIIVGGDSRRGKLDPEHLRQQLRQIFARFPEHRFWLTTSRRTPPAVETMLRGFSWERAIYYSEEPINPIPDYLVHSSYVFLTADSTSMISEAVCFGSACVEILADVRGGSGPSKVDRMIDALVARNSAHRYSGQVGSARNKIDLYADLRGATEDLGFSRRAGQSG